MKQIKHFCQSLIKSVNSSKELPKSDNVQMPNKCSKCCYHTLCTNSPSSDCEYVFEEQHFPVMNNSFH